METRRRGEDNTPKGFRELQALRTSTVIQFLPSFFFKNYISSLCAQFIAEGRIKINDVVIRQEVGNFTKKLLCLITGNYSTTKCNNRSDKSNAVCKFAQSTRCYTTYPTESIPLMRGGRWKSREHHVAFSRLIRLTIPAKRTKVLLFCLCCFLFLPVLESFTFLSPPYICVSGLYASFNDRSAGSALQATPASSQAHSTILTTC